MSKNRPLMIVFMSVPEWLTSVFCMKHLNAEGPIDVSPEDNPTSEPKPDIAVLAKAGPEYPGSNPPASDVRLAVKVSDSTLTFDLSPKARLYARAGIPEYWVFDVGFAGIVVSGCGRLSVSPGYSSGR